MILNLLRNYRVTMIVSMLALLAWASPLMSGWLQLDFAAVADGQWWRIWTGHVTHYDGQHLFWDLLMFAVLGASCERNHPRTFLLAILCMAASITVTIAVWCESISVYRGLSGIDTGLFVWFVADQCRQCWNQRDRLAAALWVAPCLGLIGKLIFEASTGQTLFVDSSGFTPLVESHLGGAAMGLICSGTMRFLPCSNRSNSDLPASSDNTSRNANAQPASDGLAWNETDTQLLATK